MFKKPYIKLIAFYVLVFAFCGRLTAQESNFLMPVPEIEHKLQFEDYTVFRATDARFPGDIVKRCIFRWPDQSMLQLKMKRAPTGGHITNNAPRFEMAAYQFQKMFLDYDDYVVPPTYGRSMPVKEYGKYEIQVEPTFKNTSCVFFVLQCWLENVTTDFIFDKKRFKKDSLYAYYIANLNIYTYLIEHNDSNKGNFLISTLPDLPRVYAVDNGMAFGERESRRGTFWRDMRVSKLPATTVAKLKTITTEQLKQKLGVVAQYEIIDGMLEPAAVTENLDPKKGVRLAGAKVQFGLTDPEIAAIARRLKKLIEDIDKGKYTLF